jgi:hypothetical protein
VKWIGKNIVDDVSLFRNDVHLDEKVVDSTGSAGTAGQQLLSTATAAVWTDQTYTYTQNGSSHTWVIEHNLNKFPSATVIDSGGSVVVGCIEYDSTNQLTITFYAGGNLSAFSGKAYLN